MNLLPYKINPVVPFPGNMTLFDLIPLEDLQHMQDSLAQTHAMSMFITDTDGNRLTVPSNSYPICRLVRRSPSGLAECNRILKSVTSQVRENRRTTCAVCSYLGGLNAAVPIEVQGVHLANWWVSQVSVHLRRFAELKKTAAEIGIDPRLLSHEMTCLPRTTETDFHKAVSWIGWLSAKITDMAFQKMKLSRQVSKLKGVQNGLNRHKSEMQLLQKANDELQRLANLDSLTQIANRRQFDDQLKMEWRRALRDDSFLAVIMCDIDYFKKYNDTYGHVKGDNALHAIAQAIAASLKRPMDLVTRYGGEEFAILLPNTIINGAVQVAVAIKRSIASLGIDHAASPVHKTITLSFGVAAVAPDGIIEPGELIETADRALYQAKSGGRNRIVQRPLPSKQDGAMCRDCAGCSSTSKMTVAPIQ